MADSQKPRARGRGKPTAQVPGASAAASSGPPPAAPANVRARARATSTAQGAVPGQDRPGRIAGVTQQMAGVKLGSTGSSDTDTPASTSVGRGQVRGRRVNEESLEKMIRTKPERIVSKKASAHWPKGKPLPQQNFTVNYFKVNKMPTWTLNLYRIDFNPPEDIMGVKRGLLRDHKDKIGAYVFDGTMMFTPNTIIGKEMKLMSKKRDETPVELTIRHVRVLEYGDAQYTQLFNILIRQTLRALDLKLLGRNYFDPAAKEDIPQYRLEVWPGWDTSMRQMENDIMLCVELSHKVLRKETVLDAWEQCRNDKRKFEAQMTNSIVLTKYNNKTYRVDDIQYDVTPCSTFPMKGENVSYIDYYQKKYNETIRNRNQPMIVHKSKLRELRAGQSEIIYLVPELCYLTGLSDDMRADFRLMKPLGEITRVRPRERVAKFNVFRKRIENSEAKEVLKRWELALDTNLARVQGHILPPDSIIFSDPLKPFPVGPDANWTTPTRSSVFRAPNLERWCVLTTGFMMADTENFLQLINKAAQGMRFKVNRPNVCTLQNDRAQSYALELDKIVSENQYQLIMAIIPNNQADRYNSIKRKCAIDWGVPSQVIVKKNLASKGALTIATKVAIQLCCKIGGAPWSVAVPLKGLMVLGFDVTHDSDLKGSSYGALVASIDPQMSSWFSRVSPHRSGNELSNDIAVSVVHALHKYRERNNAVPVAILMYRDGVGEGQINQVIEHELDQIQKAIADLNMYEANKIPLSFVIVTKRISTRIMTDSDNPMPGSVVDDVITSPERYDFFLVSQSVNQGTVSPTYYNVIHDTVPQFNPDRLQRITYKMCHLYYNWSGTVRVPAPCQYAHKLAFLCGQNLHRAPSTQLENLLHFL